MSYQSFLNEIIHGQWQSLETSLANAIHNSPNNPELLSCAAHLSLCQGYPKRSRILAEKALGIHPDYIPALLELALIDFYQGDLETSLHKLKAISPQSISKCHPASLAKTYLQFVFDDDSIKKKFFDITQIDFFSTWLGTPEAFDSFIDVIKSPESMPSFDSNQLSAWANQILATNNKLAANFFAKFCLLLAPTAADSFLAVGCIYLHLGYLEGASRALHEAAFRQAQDSNAVLWLTLSLYCRQQRYPEALDIISKLIDANAMTLDCLGIYIDLQIRCGAELSFIEQELQACLAIDGAHENLVLRASAIRLALYTGEIDNNNALQNVLTDTALMQCAAGKYLYAQLVRDIDPHQAEKAAEQAYSIAPFHPDAANWASGSEENKTVFEYMGLFLPTEHEGCAWPNQIQLNLLKVIFADTSEEILNRWQKFLDQFDLSRLDAGCYRLLPMLHIQLTRLCSRTQWPRKEMLKGVWKKSFLENTTRLKLMLDMTKTLNADGVKFILLKGLANAIGLYGDLGARPMSDIDILIKPKDLENCHQSLIEQGWHTDTPPSPARKRFQYASTYYHANGGNLDLHWRPAEEFTSDYYDPNDLGTTSQFAWMGKTFDALNPTTNLACTILHGCAWNHLSPVRWISDSLLLLKDTKNPIDWTSFEALVDRYHFRHVTHAGLRFLAQEFPGVAHLIPKCLLESEPHPEETTLLNIRCRSRSATSSCDEILILASKARKQFNLDRSDQFWACANHLAPQEVDQLKEHGIRWMPHYDPQIFDAEINENRANNCLVFDANRNGYLQTVCRLQLI
ncbi:MAG: nucleotidyltransferase family protein [Fluviibacter sp.]